MINMEEEAYEFSKMFNERCSHFALKIKKKLTSVMKYLPYFLPVLSFQLTLSWRPAVAASQREAQLFCNLLFSAFVVATSISIEKPRKSFELLPLLFRSSRTVSQRSQSEESHWQIGLIFQQLKLFPGLSFPSCSLSPWGGNQFRCKIRGFSSYFLLIFWGYWFIL